MSDATRMFGPGTKLKVLDTGTYRDIAAVRGIPGPKFATDDVDARELDPYAGGTTPAVYQFVKQWVAGWVDLGEVEIDCRFTQVEFAFFSQAQLNGTVLAFRIDFKNGYSLCLKGYVKGVGPDVPLDDIINMPLTIKLTSGVLFALTSSAGVTAWA